jgi:hypothetical protein
MRTSPPYMHAVIQIYTKSDTQTIGSLKREDFYRALALVALAQKGQPATLQVQRATAQCVCVCAACVRAACCVLRACVGERRRVQRTPIKVRLASARSCSCSIAAVASFLASLPFPWSRGTCLLLLLLLLQAMQDWAELPEPTLGDVKEFEALPVDFAAITMDYTYRTCFRLVLLLPVHVPVPAPAAVRPCSCSCPSAISVLAFFLTVSCLCHVASSFHAPAPHPHPHTLERR